jgi:hypothetical protein
MDALGLTADPAWTSPLDPLPPVRWLASRSEDLRWFWQHAGPWVKRRVTGQSSGDAVLPKRPALEPLTGTGDSPGMTG